MKDTNKVTLTLGQLKRLIKESKQLNEGSIYMGCHVYRVGNNWVIYDEDNKQLVAKIPNYEFMHNDKINDGEIIRKWRETHPGKQVVEAKEFDGLSVKEIKELIKYADNVDKLAGKIRDAAFDVKVVGKNLLEAIDDLEPYDDEEKVDGAVVDMAQNTKNEFMHVCKKLQKVLANSRLPQF